MDGELEGLDKPLPSNTYVEGILVASIFIDNNLMDEAAERLSFDKFYNPFHAHIFKAQLGCRNQGFEINIGNVLEEMKRQGSPEGIQDVGRIAKLLAGIPMGMQITGYIDTILDKALARDIIKANNRATAEVLSQEKPANEYLEDHQSQLFQLSLRGEQKGFSRLIEMVDRSISRVAEIAETGQPITGITTGFTDIDNKTLGLQRDDLIILAARPSMGKTALMIDIGLNGSVDHGKHVAVFSLEMGEISISDRIICSRAGVDSMKWRAGALDEDEWELIHEARNTMVTTRLFADDTPGMDVNRMRNKLRRLVAENGPLDEILVDYIQLMEATKRSDNRQQEVSQISRELKQLAKEMNCPLIALSQLSRAPENRSTNHRPLLSDLRESGAIEQDADVVAFLYRDSYYNPPEVIDEDALDPVEFIIAKQRNGPTGTVNLLFNRKTTKFQSAANDY